VELERLGLFENPMTSSGFKPTAYWLQQSASKKKERNFGSHHVFKKLLLLALQ
jgi:hypothetical protein